MIPCVDDTSSYVFPYGCISIPLRHDRPIDKRFGAVSSARIVSSVLLYIVQDIPIFVAFRILTAMSDSDLQENMISLRPRSRLLDLPREVDMSRRRVIVCHICDGTLISANSGTARY